MKRDEKELRQILRDLNILLLSEGLITAMFFPLFYLKKHYIGSNAAAFAISPDKMGWHLTHPKVPSLVALQF